jgi:hypothetical protein
MDEKMYWLVSQQYWPEALMHLISMNLMSLYFFFMLRNKYVLKTNN